MNIGEGQLKGLVLRVLSDLEVERRTGYMENSKQTLHMSCVPPRSERYMEFLKKAEELDTYDIVPVVPPSWKNMGYEVGLRQSVFFGKIPYRSGETPDNLDRTAMLLPVVPRNVLVKTALCINDIYEISQIAECMKQGNRAILLLTGLEKFSGNEKPVHRKRIMEYYRQVLESEVEIYSAEELLSRAPYEILCEGTGWTMAYRTKNSTCILELDKRKKRVISSSSVKQFVFDGVIYLRLGDTVTDLARDRAKFLKIVFK